MPKELIGEPISEAYYNRLCKTDFNTLFDTKFIPCRQIMIKRRDRIKYHSLGLVPWICPPKIIYHKNQINQIEQVIGRLSEKDIETYLKRIAKENDGQYYLKNYIYDHPVFARKQDPLILPFEDTPPSSPKRRMEFLKEEEDRVKKILKLE